MFIYKITFLGGSSDLIRANDPKQAWKLASDKFKDLEVVFIKFVR